MSEEPSPDQLDALPTSGELFADGTAIELLSRARLAFWLEGKATIALTAQHDGQTYTALSLDPKLEAALALPSAVGDLQDLDSLISDLSAVTRARSEVDEEQAILIAAFVLSTWVMDCLPASLCLNLWGPQVVATNLSELLCCLCRHPLPLNEVRLSELLKLPEGLCPTIVLSEPAEVVLRRLLTSATQPRGLILRGGRPVQMRYSTVVCSKFPIAMPAISVAMLAAGSRYHKSSSTDLQQLADEFRPRLLHFRLSQHVSVAESHFDVPEFAPAIRHWARCLGAVLEQAPESRARMMKAFTTHDENEKSEQSQGADAVVLEALLAACHEEHDAGFILVGDIAELVNTIFLGRHDDRELSPKGVGYVLRRQLGFSPKRRNWGYGLELTNSAKERIHQLSASHHVLSALAPNPDCVWCGNVLGTHRTDLKISSSPSSPSAQPSEVESPEAPTAQP